MKISILNRNSLNTDLASVLLRLIFGGLFMYHGYTKYAAFDQILPMFPDLIGIGSKTSFILVVSAELVCGFFVAIGFLTRLAVIPLFITMMTAYFLAHAADPFQKKELPLFFLLLCLVVFILGSGKYSVDSLLFRRRQIS